MVVVGAGSLGDYEAIVLAWASLGVGCHLDFHYLPVEILYVVVLTSIEVGYWAEAAEMLDVVVSGLPLGADSAAANLGGGSDSKVLTLFDEVRVEVRVLPGVRSDVGGWVSASYIGANIPCDRVDRFWCAGGIRMVGALGY